MDRGFVRSAVCRVAGVARIKPHVHPHLFRHWLCTTLLERGVNLRMVSDLAGHARLSTTGNYTTVTRELMRKTIAESHPRAAL
jgi:integrase/recombinase XerC/integrase/recombinase XerD